MMRHLLFAAAAAVACAVPAVAQEASIPGKPNPALATAGTYKIDGGHTQVVFTVNHMGYSEYSGQFTKPTGSLVLDPANPSKDKVEVVFPIAQLQTTVGALDEHLKSPDFFDAAKFPEGKFVSTKVTITGKTATIAGNLTLKGVTKPVVLAARFIGAGTNPHTKTVTVGFQATTVVKRSAFGVSFGIPVVSDDVRLTINASFDHE